MLKLLLKLAAVALLANAAWRIGSSYVSFYKFKDAVAEEAQFGVDKSVDQLRERVVGLAQQFDLPVDGDALTIAKGDQSNVDDARQVLVRTEAEWTKLWQQHAPDHPKPAVDFSKEMVVAVFMGSRPTAGFSTAIISATAANGALNVRYSESRPPAGGVTAQVLTFPYHIAAIPKADVKDVKFEKVQ